MTHKLKTDISEILHTNNQYHKNTKAFLIWMPVNVVLLSAVISDLWRNQRNNTVIIFIEYTLALICILNLLYLFAQRFLIHYFPKKYNVTGQQFSLLQEIGHRIAKKCNINVITQQNDEPQIMKTDKINFENFRASSSSLFASSNTPVKSDTLHDSSKEKIPIKRYHASPSSLFANSPVVADLMYDSTPIDSPSSNYSGNLDNSPNSSVLSSNLSKTMPSFMEGTFSNDESVDEVDSLKKCIENTRYRQSFGVHEYSDYWKTTDSAFVKSPYGRRSTDIILNDVYQLSSTTTSEYVKPVHEVSSLGTNPTICKKFGINQSYLSEWIANLRLWITQTILVRIISEISEINKALTLHGITNVSIGSCGLERLKKTAAMSQVYQNIPSLTNLISFLDISSNQEYVVQRITALSTGSMSNYCWNAGGMYEGKPWNDSLPTDSALVMHLIAAYFDSQLFPLPHTAPDGRQFSSAHYIKTPSIPAKNSKSLIIYQQSIYPPHFQLIIGEEIYDISRGRNNLFHVILFFLQHIKTKESGMFEHVNLGSSGINMLWIINDLVHNMYKQF